MRTFVAAVAMIIAMFLAGLLMSRNMSLGSAFLLVSFALIAVLYVMLPGRD